MSSNQGCPACPNCETGTVPTDCSITIHQNNIQVGATTWTHNSFSNSPSSASIINRTVTIEIQWWDENGVFKSYDETDIVFSSGPDYADKVKLYLETKLGGVWTVTVGSTTDVHGVEYRITNVSSVGARGYINELNVFTQDHGWSYHNVGKTSYADPYITAAQTLLSSALPTDSDVPCLWEGREPLFTTSGTGALYYYFKINASSIECEIFIYDHDENVKGSAFFSYLTAPAGSGYECDKRYGLTQRSATSDVTPYNNRGPAPVDVVDWSGAVITNMNIAEQNGN